MGIITREYVMLGNNIGSTICGCAAWLYPRRRSPPHIVKMNTNHETAAAAVGGGGGGGWGGGAMSPWGVARLPCVVCWVLRCGGMGDCGECRGRLANFARVCSAWCGSTAVRSVDIKQLARPGWRCTSATCWLDLQRAHLTRQ